MNNKIKIVLSIFIIIGIILIILKLKGEFLTKEPTSTCTLSDNNVPNRENFLNNVVATFASSKDLNPSYFSIDDILKKKITEDIKTRVENRLKDNVDKYLNKFIENSTKITNIIDSYKSAKISEIPYKIPQFIESGADFEIALSYDLNSRLYNKPRPATLHADFKPNKPSTMKWDVLK
jgi:hypothetical protein